MGAAGVTFGVMTRGAPVVWPVVVPGVELLVAGVELLTAVRSLTHGPNSINAPAITTAAITAVIDPVPIPVLRLSRPAWSLIDVRLLMPVGRHVPADCQDCSFHFSKVDGKNPSIINCSNENAASNGGQLSRNAALSPTVHPRRLSRINTEAADCSCLGKLHGLMAL